MDVNQSQIHGSIKYTVIGRYVAEFRDFTGMVDYDPKLREVKSVNLTIKTMSLKSKHPTLDKIVLSKRLLNVKKYPEISFQSKRIKKNKDGYYVRGDVNLHGVSEAIGFPFTVEGPLPSKNHKKVLRAHGRWILNRKDFKVIWNILLDQGGVIVGDHIMVDWQIVAVKSNT